MQRQYRAIARLGALLMAGLGLGSAVAADYKIGYVNIQQVVQESQEAQEAKGQLEEEVRKRKAELKQKRQEVSELKKKLEKQGSLMSGEQKQEAKRQLQQALREFRRFQQKAQKDLDTRKDRVLRELYAEISQIVDRIGKTEDYDLILTGSATLFASDSINLTQQVVGELNQQDEQ